MSLLALQGSMVMSTLKLSGLMVMLIDFLKDSRMSLRCGCLTQINLLSFQMDFVPLQPQQILNLPLSLMKVNHSMAFSSTPKSHTLKMESKFWRTLLSEFVELGNIGLWLTLLIKKFFEFAN